MSLLQKTPKSYLAEIIIRKKRTILVEGTSDKKLFEALVNRLCNFYSKNYCDIKIDSVEIFKIPGVIGNRAKVEAICSFILNSGALEREGIKFAGFVDREFDKFNIDELQALLDEHYVEGCLVYSRGHSIENYFIYQKAVQMQKQLEAHLREQVPPETEQINSSLNIVTTMERLKMLKQTIISLQELSIREAIEEGRRF